MCFATFESEALARGEDECGGHRLRPKVHVDPSGHSSGPDVRPSVREWSTRAQKGVRVSCTQSRARRGRRSGDPSRDRGGTSEAQDDEPTNTRHSPSPRWFASGLLGAGTHLSSFAFETTDALCKDERGQLAAPLSTTTPSFSIPFARALSLTLVPLVTHPVKVIKISWLIRDKEEQDKNGPDQKPESW